MTPKEIKYRETLKKISEATDAAVLEYAVLKRTSFLEHEDTKERDLIVAQRVKKQQNTYTSDMLCLLDELTRIKWE
jgi:hypothetical protein